MGAGDRTVVEHAVCNGVSSLLLIPKLSRSFALTIPKLPPDLQSTVGVAYLLCRAVDTIEDSRVAHPDQKASQLDDFLAAVDDDDIVQDVSRHFTAELSGQVSREELALIDNLPLLFGALNEFSPRQQAAVRTCLRKMASGMKSYVGRPNGLSDMGELDRYCYVVAGVVGEMLTELFCDHCSEIDSRKEALEKLAASYGQLGRVAEAKAEWAESLHINPDYSLERRRQILPYKNPSDFDRVVDGLRKVGLPE